MLPSHTTKGMLTHRSDGMVKSFALECHQYSTQASSDYYLFLLFFLMNISTECSPMETYRHIGLNPYRGATEVESFRFVLELILLRLFSITITGVMSDSPIQDNVSLRGIKEEIDRDLNVEHGIITTKGYCHTFGRYCKEKECMLCR